MRPQIPNLMEQPKIERLLRLIPLLANNHYATIEELSQQLNVQARTLYRDINTLRKSGLVINKENNIYKLDKKSPYFEDFSDLLYFSPEEAYVLKSAIDSIDDTNIIKQNLKKKLYSLYDYKLVTDVVVKPQIKDNLHNLFSAIEGQKQAILQNYNSAHSNNLSDRLVEPFAFTTNFEQVWCFEPAAGCVKLFKTGRIESVTVTDNSWQFSAWHETGYLDIFRMHSSQRMPIQLRLSVRAANLLMEEYPLAAEQMQQIEDNCWLLTTDVCSYEGPARFILGLYHDIEIVNSPGLAQFISKKIRNMREIDQSANAD